MVARIFRSFPGMEYCDLKRDRVTGQSKGYAYVNYSTADAAAAAVEQLNGLEFPPHSGQRLKVMFAEPMNLRAMGQKPSPPEAARMHLAASQESEEVVQQHTGSMSGASGLDDISSHLPLRVVGSPGFAEDLEHRVEVAAVQNSLAQMSMPHGGHQLSGLRQENGSPGSVASWEGESAPPPPDSHLVYTVLSRPLPDYAIEHTCRQCGPVEWVQLQQDQRVAMVRFASAETAAVALEQLNGSQICGESLTITAMNPLQHSRISKRVRTA
eukprot:jgi/Astpho2/3567/Aster-x0169